MRVLLRNATILWLSIIGLIASLGQTPSHRESIDALVRGYFFGSPGQPITERDILERGREVMPLLAAYATNSEPLIRLKAVHLLVKIRGKGYIPILVRALETENVRHLKAGIVESMFRFCPTNDVQPHWAQLRPLLRKYALETKNPRLSPESAIFLLERFDGVQAVPDLKEIRRVAMADEGFDPSKSGRAFALIWFNRTEACLLALARQGDADAQAEINRLLDSPDVYTTVAGIKYAYLAGDIFGAKLYRLLDRDDLATDTVEGSSFIRSRICEHAAMALEHIYEKHDLRPYPPDSIETFVVPDGQVLRRFTEKASHEWIKRMKAALRSRLAPANRQP